MNLSKITSLFFIGLIFSSCASLLAPRYQKVAINKDEGAVIAVDGKEAKISTEQNESKGKYILDKKAKPIQLRATKEGFKDINVVAFPYKLHPLRYLSMATLILAPVDHGLKAFKFDKELSVGMNMLPLPVKKEGDKEIQLIKVSADIKGGNIKSRSFSTMKEFYKWDDYEEPHSVRKPNDFEAMIDNHQNLLNKILKKSGFIDTTRRALKNSYSNNLFVNANINSVTYHNIAYGEMIYVDLGIEWEILDYYKNPIHTVTTNSTSGQFANPTKHYQDHDNINFALDDAMEYGLIEFLMLEKVQSLLQNNSETEKESKFAELSIPSSENYVNNVSQSIKSGVTIKNKEGHGSGFIVSSVGHIITNYHVIANQEKLKVITNDGKKYDVEIIRESRINDLALIKIEASGLVPFKLESSKEINVADVVYAVGTPSSTDLSQTISKGIISGVRDSDSGSKLIQTDVSVNSGNSGGALINKDGKVLGVVSSKLVGIGIEGVAFGIPAYTIIDKLKISQ